MADFGNLVGIFCGGVWLGRKKVKNITFYFGFGALA